MSLSSRAGRQRRRGLVGRSGSRVAVGPAVRSPHDQWQSHRPLLSGSTRSPPWDGARRRSCCCAPFRRSSTCWRFRSASGSCAGCSAHDGVDSHGAARDPADGDRAQPHLPGSVAVGVLDGPRHLSVPARPRGRQAGMDLPRRRGSGVPGRALDASDQRLHRSIPGPAVRRSRSPDPAVCRRADDCCFTAAAVLLQHWGPTRRLDRADDTRRGRISSWTNRGCRWPRRE